MHQTTGRGKCVAAVLGQVLPGGDAELGREGLDQHGHQVAGHDHPQQRVAELGAALDVGGEVARVHVGDAGDEGRPQERQDLPQPSAAERPGPGRPPPPSCGRRASPGPLQLRPDRPPGAWPFLWCPANMVACSREAANDAVCGLVPGGGIGSCGVGLGGAGRQSGATLRRRRARRPPRHRGPPSRIQKVRKYHSSSRRSWNSSPAKKYEEAAGVCRELVRLAPKTAAKAITTSPCTLARLGKTEDAFAAIKRAAERGFSDAEHMKVDEDLAAAAGGSSGSRTWSRRPRKTPTRAPASPYDRKRRCPA